jgi:adenine-specific DNA-methyltransferase
MQNLYKDLIQELAKNEKFLLQGQVSASLVRDKAYKLDPELVGLLFGNDRLKQEFFTETNGAMIFNYPKFAKFITNKEFLPDSYTEFESNVGLSVGDKFLSENKEVVLSFPFKDCILEGGMDTEEAKNRKEIFYNQTLAPDDIHKLKSPKALKSFEKHTVKGKEEVRELKLNDDGTFNENFIIKGNNLLALYSLLPRYKGKVKLIYIDPPYNTGNDGFKYNDNFNHSTWLTFMKNRLEIARELLRDDGVIFVQCDDNEQAYLKVLMDEVFGRENFVSDIITRATPNARDYGLIAQMHEYIILFAKNINQTYTNLLEIEDREYSFSDNSGEFNIHPLYNSNVAFNIDNRKNLYYPFYINLAKQDKNGFFEISLEKQNGFIEIYPPKSVKDKVQFVWRWGKEKSIENINKEIVGHRTRDGDYRIVQKMRGSSQLVRSIWYDTEFSNRRATEDLQKLFKNKVFSFPKSEYLLKRIIDISTNPGDIVLDYHLGSGTTCAVAHKMGRRYIGVEQMDYIETIAVERMKKVVGKQVKSKDLMEENIFEDFDTGGVSKAVNWQGGDSFIYLELAKNNIIYLEKIESLVGDSEAWSLFEELSDSIWISYRVDIDKFKEHKDQFLALHLEDQKKVLRDIINYNHLYVNYEDMEDIAYKDCGLSTEDKALTTQFYEKKPTDQNELL